ncbi:DMT(drug/metabolite transporter) superfamily permease [Desulfosporosinus orientis DSM 765]|uniref:DMT(Drug/metabolite transporter) superfamily permease n=1 Tax=Desulfosporosinus orientis (strain ATCC 19365 / DSM 765 / NCIMB 8382 / VKM B-1628 / Singapore I) TaxID=768706 RepID=G7WCI2_DESOD|nr:DMT family transporter [Desulfosporosinus orientis]AET66304.1 DMT(drug/metabolite transporter) superfamily permease [Desulfosporosinus orientis DSM 765]
MNPRKRSLLEVHLAVILFGLSGLFGKLLTISSAMITFGRVLFSCIFLLLVFILFKKQFKIKRQRDIFCLIAMGLILAIHWGTFFKSIQMSTVAIGLLTFSTFPIFVTFIEPFLSKDRIKLSDIILAFGTFIGIIFVVPQFNLENNSTQGVVWGIVSGFSYAVLSMLNKKFVSEYPGEVIAFYEQFFAALILAPFLIFQKPVISSRDVVLLVILGVIFTGLSHSLFINSLRGIKTQTAGIISCLEPVYGIFFAGIILKEALSFKEIVGGVIVLSTVLYATIKVNKSMAIKDLPYPDNRL